MASTTKSRSKKTTATKSTNFSARVEQIGPAKAKRYLATMARNRRKRGRLRERFKNSMAAGHWKLTGEAIKFNTKGELIDGQHRLEAIIESGQTVEILVCRNVPDDAFMELDTGGSRTPGDILTVAGHEYTSGIASAIRHLTSLYEIEAGTMAPSSLAKKRVEPQILLEYAEEHREELIDAVKKVKSKEARVVCGPPALFSALFFIFAEYNSKGAEEFFDGLVNGVQFEYGTQDPVYQLRRVLLDLRTSKHKRRPNHYKAALTIKAWNAFQARNPVASLRYSENEGWPEIDRRKTRTAASVAERRRKKKSSHFNGKGTEEALAYASA